MGVSVERGDNAIVTPTGGDGSWRDRRREGGWECPDSGVTYWAVDVYAGL